MGSEQRRERNNQINERIATGAAEVIAIPVDGPVGVLEAAIARREQDWMREKADNEGDGIMSVGGLAATTQPLDLDALLAIDAKRRKRSWPNLLSVSPCPTLPPVEVSSMPLDLLRDRQMIEGVRRSQDRDWGECAKMINPDDADEWLDEIERLQAIVNSLRPLVERCKQAERSLLLVRDSLALATMLKDEMARQRDDLLVACEEIHYHSVWCDARHVAGKAIASVKGGADGETDCS